AIFVMMLGFTSKPRTHVYTFFAPWTLLAGLVVKEMGAWLMARQWSPRRVAWVGATVATIAALIFGSYTYQIFAQAHIERLRTWQEHWPWGYWRPFAVVDNDALFGFPLASGWKVVGQLYAGGTLTGDYATNEVEYWSPI